MISAYFLLISLVIAVPNAYQRLLVHAVRLYLSFSFSVFCASFDSLSIDCLFRLFCYLFVVLSTEPVRT